MRSGGPFLLIYMLIDKPTLLNFWYTRKSIFCASVLACSRLLKILGKIDEFIVISMTYLGSCARTAFLQFRAQLRIGSMSLNFLSIQ